MQQNVYKITKLFYKGSFFFLKIIEDSRKNLLSMINLLILHSTSDLSFKVNIWNSIYLNCGKAFLANERLL